MMPRIPLLLCVLLLLPSSPVAAESTDEVLEKIRRLEQQIQELKALKEQQRVASEKEDHCMKAFGREKFCKCVSAGLPREVGFEQYVQTLITPRAKLGYDGMTPERKNEVDTIVALRERCVEKGFFK